MRARGGTGRRRRCGCRRPRRREPRRRPARPSRVRRSSTRAATSRPSASSRASWTRSRPRSRATAAASRPSSSSVASRTPSATYGVTAPGPARGARTPRPRFLDGYDCSPPNYFCVAGADGRELGPLGQSSTTQAGGPAPRRPSSTSARERRLRPPAHLASLDRLLNSGPSRLERDRHRTSRYTLDPTEPGNPLGRRRRLHLRTGTGSSNRLCAEALSRSTIDLDTPRVPSASSAPHATRPDAQRQPRCHIEHHIDLVTTKLMRQRHAAARDRG